MAEETIAYQLQHAAVPFETLGEKYRPMLGLVDQLIGVVPNCDPLLEIWPTGFRTYNLLVPNLLNLPHSLFGRGAPKELVGLAMYRSSFAAGCPYCTAHCCSYALRRGLPDTAIAESSDDSQGAVRSFADALGALPDTLTPDDYARINAHLSDSDCEWIALSVGLMGFLNKFMDAMGVPLEEDSIANVGALLACTGWTPGKHSAIREYQSPGGETATDNIRTYANVLRHAPGALSLERSWTGGVPNAWPAVGDYLRQSIGCGFPLLSRLTHGRAIRAIATVLCSNQSEAKTVLGLTAKNLSGMVYATVACDPILYDEAQLLLEHASDGGADHDIDAVVRFAKEAHVEDVLGLRNMLAGLVASGFDETCAAAMIVARATASSPAVVGQATLAEITPKLEPAALVELIVWLSVQQMLHRLHRFVAVRDA